MSSYGRKERTFEQRKVKTSYMGSKGDNSSGFDEVNPKEAKIIARRIFEHYDKDRSGVIEPHEISAMISDAYQGILPGYNPNQAEVNGFISIQDRNKDGSVTLEDMEKTVARYLGSDLSDFLGGVDSTFKTQIETRANLQRSTVQNPDFHRVVNEKEDLKKSLIRKHTFEAVEREIKHAHTIFSKYDTNQNGFLEYDEVVPILIDTYKMLKMNFNPSHYDTTKYIEMMDTDRDGRISKDEYELFVLKALKSRGISL